MAERLDASERPTGETAATLRVLYLARAVRAGLGDRKAGAEADRIMAQLLGPAPPKGIRQQLQDRRRKT